MFLGIVLVIACVLNTSAMKAITTILELIFNSSSHTGKGNYKLFNFFKKEVTSFFSKVKDSFSIYISSYLIIFAFSLLFSSKIFGQVSLITSNDGGFENVTSAFINNGWTSVGTTGTTSKTWRVGNFGGYSSGTNAAYWGSTTAYGGGANSAVGHFYRDIVIPVGATSVYLNYKLKYPTIDNGYDYFYVFTTTTAYTPANAVVPTTGYTNCFTNTATVYAAFTAMPQVDLTSLAGTTVRLVFTFKTDAVSPNAAPVVDDISLTYIAAGPCSVTPSALTSSAVTGTTATISWTAASPAPLSGYEYYVSTSSTAPTAGTAASGSVAAGVVTKALTGLTASTPYYFWIRSNCNGTDKSSWAGSGTFTTPCAAASIPWTEGFESGYTNTTAVGGCWTGSSLTGAEVWTANSSALDYNRTPRNGSWNATLIYSNEDWFFYPVQLTGGTNYTFAAYARQDGATSTNANITLAYGTAASAASMTNTILAASGIIDGTYQLKTGTFTPSSTGIYYMGIKGFMNGTPWYISLDDISVTVSPACAAQTSALTSSSVTGTTATISWTAASPAPGSGYEYYVSTSSTAPTAGTTASGSVAAGVLTKALTGLTAITPYYFWVRSNCNGTDKSSWAGSGTFTTLLINDACANATNLPCGTSSLAGTTVGAVSETAPTGNSSAYGVWYNFTGDGVSTTISSLSGSGFDHELTIFSGASCGSTYTLVVSADDAVSAQTETYTFTPVSGTNYYVYIAHYSSSSTTTGTFTISRTCAAPAIVVSVSNVSICSGSSSTISASSSASYTYSWSPSTGLNVSTGSSVVASPTVTTTYTVTGTSGSSSVTSSTTITVIPSVSNVTASISSNSICLGNALNLTSTSTVSGTSTIYTQNFATSTIPSGVSTVIGSGDAIAIYNTSSAGGSGYEAVITGNSMNASIVDRLVTGPINTSGQTSMTLQWRNYLNHYSNSYAYGVSVQTSTDNITWHNTSWVTTTVTSSMPSSLQSLVLNSSDVGSSTLYISFTLSGLTFGIYDWYIDDISLLGVGTNSYSWTSVPAGFTSSLQNPTNVSPSSSTVYTVSVLNLNGCATTASTSVTVNLPTVPTTSVVAVGDLVWTGGVSTNYSLSSNWIYFNGSNYVVNTVVPSNVTNIVIPPVGTCVMNQPVITSATVNAKDVVISNGGTLTLGAGGYLIVKGNWTNNSTTAALSLNATATVKFNGTSLQTISELFPSVFSNLTIENLSNVKMLSDLTVLNTLTLTNGKFIVDFGKTLYIGTNVSPVSNGTITGASGSSYIVAYDNGVGIGSVKRVINSAGSTLYEFPIGDLTNYTPLSYTLVSGTLSNATLTVYTKPSKIFGLNVQLSNYLNRYWEVLPSGITNSVYNVSFNFTNADIVGTETSLIPIKKSGSTWYKPTGTSFLTGTEQGTSYTFDAGTNRLSWNGLSTYSKFGGVGNQAVNLPIELLDFVGENLNKSNVLSWTTFSELDNDFFTIEYSTDGYNFENIGLVNGAGNSSGSNEYEFIHSDYRNEINYYRLLQTDFNGMTNKSELISIDNSEKLKEILMTTNLIGQEVNENYKGLVVIIYTDGTILRKIQ